MKLYNERELLKNLFTSINVRTCSRRTHERKEMQLIRGDYANSLLDEKKKNLFEIVLTAKHDHCILYLLLPARKMKNFWLSIIITFTKQPHLIVQKRESLSSNHGQTRYSGFASSRGRK